MPDSRFTDRLLAADPPNPTARGRYEQKVRAMFDTTVGPRKRGLYLLTAVVLAGMAGVFFFTVRAPGDSWPPPEGADFARVIRVFGVATAATLAATALLSGRLWWTGVEDRRTAARWGTLIGVCYVGVIGWFLVGLSRHLPEPMRDELRVVGGMVALIALGTWVRGRVARAEQATAERLLELELRLAEMQEAMKSRPA